MKNKKNEAVERLFHAMLLLESEDECSRFFDDLCTIKEIQDMAQRLDTARLIDRGVSYQKISDKTGVSTATISRVSRCLHYGAGGYQSILQKLNAEEENE